MGNFFETPETPNKMMEETKIQLKVGAMNFERVKEGLEEDCEELKYKAKETYEKGNKEECKMYLKQIVRYKSASTKITGCMIKMKEMEFNVQMMQSQQTMQKALIDVTRAMHRINDNVDVKQMKRVIRHFEKQGWIMQEKQEMVEEKTDETMSEFDDETKENEMMEQLMSEIGIEIDLPQQNQSMDMNGMEERIKNLKK